MAPADIRRAQDLETGKWYFSIVDVIALTTSSRNPQNYWKVLKNPLKKEGNQLVTRCNRLKMKARDSKSYLTDAADEESLTEIIKLIPGARVNELEACFAPFITPPGLPEREEKESPPFPSERAGERSEPEAHPSHEATEGAAEFLIDAYQTPDAIFIEAFIAGVSLQDLNIEVSRRKIIIEGKREKLNGDYFTQELLWLSFSRTIDLPLPVDPDRARATESQGHLTIRLPRLD